MDVAIQLGLLVIGFVLLPTILPIVISALPFNAADTLTAASGRDVPIATIVRPMRRS